MTDLDLLRDVERRSTAEIDRDLADQAYHKGLMDAAYGLQPQQYFFARFQSDYNVGFNRGSGRKGVAA